MNRRSVVMAAVMAAVGFAVLTGAVAQQQRQGGGAPAAAAMGPFDGKPLKEAIVGSWRLLISDGVRSDGTQVPQWGPNPKGVVMFGPDGRYSLQIMRDIRPKFAANDRMKGTPEEIKAAFEGGLSQFGSYTLNEADKTLTLRIEGSSYPNWDGATQKRLITALVGDDFTWTNPTPPSGSDNVKLAWRRIK